MLDSKALNNNYRLRRLRDIISQLEGPSTPHEYRNQYHDFELNRIESHRIELDNLILEPETRQEYW